MRIDLLALLASDLVHSGNSSLAKGKCEREHIDKALLEVCSKCTWPRRRYAAIIIVDIDLLSACAALLVRDAVELVRVLSIGHDSSSLF